MKTRTNQPKTATVVLALSTLTLPAAAVAQHDGGSARHYRPATTRAVDGLEQMVAADGTVLYLADEIAVRVDSSASARGWRPGKTGPTRLQVDTDAAMALAVMVRRNGVDRLAVLEGERLLGTVAIRSIDDGTITVSHLRTSVAPRSEPTEDASTASSLITLVPRSTSVRAGEIITVDVLVNGVADLRTFQVAVDAIADDGARLPLASVETGSDRSDHVFVGREVVDAADQYLGRVGAVLFQGGVDVEQAGYLGSFSFATDTRAAGSYRLTLRSADSFLNNTVNGDLRYTVQGATVKVVLNPTDDAIR